MPPKRQRPPLPRGIYINMQHQRRRNQQQNDDDELEYWNNQLLEAEEEEEMDEEYDELLYWNQQGAQINQLNQLMQPQQQQGRQVNQLNQLMQRPFPPQQGPQIQQLNQLMQQPHHQPARRQRQAQQVLPAAPNQQAPQQQAQFPPIVRLGAPRQEPMGPIRGANGQLRQVQLWAVVLWLNQGINDHWRPAPAPAPNQRPVGQHYVRYIRGQLERGNNRDPNLGPNRLHLQMAVAVSDRLSALQVAAVLRLLDPLNQGGAGATYNDIWMAPINGPEVQAMLEYVHKAETAVDPHVKGNRFESGEMIEWNAAQQPEQVRMRVQAGADFGEIADEFPAYALRYASNITKQISEHERLAPPIKRYVNSYCFWGDTGTGKSHRIWNQLNPDEVYTKPSGKFFDGYQAKKHKVLVIEEAPSDMTIEYMLNAIQGHPQLVEFKGGMVRARWETVICTSNKPPSEWFPHASLRNKQALVRRFNKGIIKFVDTSRPGYEQKHENELYNASFPQEHDRVEYVDCAAIREAEEAEREAQTANRPDPFANLGR